MRDVKSAILAILAVAITLGALWHTNRPVTPKKASWNDVVAEADQGGYRLITTDELWSHYQKKARATIS